MKKLTILLVFIFPLSFLYSQDIEWGPAFEHKSYIYFLELYDNELYGISIESDDSEGGRKDYVSYYGIDLISQSKKDVGKGKFKNSDFHYLWFGDLDNKLHAIALKKSSEATYLLLYEFNEKGNEIGDPQELAELSEFSHIKQLYQYFTKQILQIFIDPSGERITILYKLEDNKSNRKFKIKVYNSKKENIRNHTIEIPATTDYFQFASIASNEENTVIHGRLYEDSVDLKKIIGSIDDDTPYEIHVINASNNNITNMVFHPRDEYGIHDYETRLDSNGMFIIQGFTTDKTKRREPVNGVFYVKINAETGERLIENYEVFSKEFKKEHRKSKYYQGGLYTLKIDKIISAPEGSVLIAEEVAAHYHSCIFLTKFDANGNMEWVDHIPLKQNESSKFSSYKMAQKDGIMYFIYHDQYRNIEKEKRSQIKYMDNSNLSVLTMVTVDPQGNISKQNLYSVREFGFRMIPFTSEQINDNEVILYTVDKNEKRARLGRLTLP